MHECALLPEYADWFQPAISLWLIIFPQQFGLDHYWVELKLLTQHIQGLQNGRAM